LSRQRFPLDRLGFLSYIGAGLVLGACRAHLQPLVPEVLPAVSADSAAAWTRGTLPHRAAAVRFKWRYQDEHLSAAGRGTARIAPPDSLRLDYASALNIRTGAGVVLGDSIAWADPADDFRSLVPAVPLLWAAFGVARPPGPDAGVTGGDIAGSRVWRFVTGADTLSYRWTAAPRRLEAEWRRGDRVVARSRTTFDAAERPAAARIDFPDAGARFELTVVGVDSAAVIPPLLWTRRR
jgi:hypothetical protein